jgi:hypothetical protein
MLPLRLEVRDLHIVSFSELGYKMGLKFIGIASNSFSIALHWQESLLH